jgi:hypothetical protein
MSSDPLQDLRRDDPNQSKERQDTFSDESNLISVSSVHSRLVKAKTTNRDDTESTEKDDAHYETEMKPEE